MAACPRPRVGRRRAIWAVVAALAVAALATVPARAAPLRRPLIAFSGNPPSGTEAQLTAEYQRLRAMGVTAVRMEFNWASIEPFGHLLGDYNWTRLDTEARAARNAGLKIMGLLDYGQPNYSAAGGQAASRGQQGSGAFGAGDPNMYPPDNPESFATFAAAVATRYRGEVMSWEVWNEENEGWRFWLPKESPAAYGRLLCAAYRSLRQVHPHVPVAFGGLFFPPLDGLLGTGGAQFLDQVLTAGGRAENHCFDAVAFHPYPYPFTSPESVVSDRGSVINAAAQLRAVLRQHQVPDRVPLWDTEIGWPTNPTSNGVTEEMQARYVARTTLLSWERAIPVVSWYEEYDGADASGTNQEDHFGFFTVNGTPKPAYRALTTLNRLLGAPGWRFVADRSRALDLPRGHGGVDEGFALEFSGPGGRRLLALWYANEEPPPGTNPVAAVVPGTPAAALSVRVALTHRAVVRDMFGNRVRVTRGLSVGQEPIYVIWRAG